MLKFSGRLSRLIQPSSPFILTAVVGLFALVGLWQVRHLLAQPYHYAWPMRDDYDEYHWYAVDVIRNGPAMSVAPVPYARPFGFLYIYFVALWYRIVGVQPPLVFVIQSAMLGGSVVLLFLAFRDALSRSAQVLLLMSLAAFAFLDIERQYAVQLFSENLLVFEIAAFFYLARRGFVDGRRWARILAFAVLGTITLTRPNAILFVPAALVWVVRRRRGARFWLDVACGLALLMAVSSLMAFRNHAAGGDWTMFPPFTREFLRGVSIPGYENVRSQLRAAGPAEEWHGTRSLIAVALQAWLHHPLLVVRDYGRKILFLAGFLPVVVSEYSYRPHWMLMWAVFSVALIRRLMHGVRLGPMMEILLIWLAAFLAPVLAIATIGNYGFRYVVPAVVPAVAGAVVLALSREPQQP